MEAAVRAYQNGNESSFSIIYNVYKPKFDRMAKRFKNEDLSQELCYALVKAVKTYSKNSVAKFNTYFWTCARNHIGSLNIRAGAKKRTAEFGEISINTQVYTENGNCVEVGDIIEDPAYEKNEERRMFEFFLEDKVFGNLKENEVKTVKMFMRGYTLEDISKVFHISSPAVYAKIKKLGTNLVGTYFADWFREKYHKEPPEVKRKNKKKS